MSNITQADIDRAMEIINTPFGGNRGMAILSKSNYMYLCGMVQAMTKRIAELEHKLANYSAAADGHTHWCPECKMRKGRIAELEAALDKAAHQLYDYSGSCPSDLYDWEHPNTCIRECDRYDSPDEAWKCWRLWLMCPAPSPSNDLA